MVQKINNSFLLLVTVLMLIGCSHRHNTLYFYQFQDRTDCEYCIPAYCFYYDTAFHYTSIRYGFYKNDNGFLRDSIYFTFMRDSIGAIKIPPKQKHNFNFDSIKCYCEYPSHWRFTFEMTVSKHGKCKLILHSPNSKKGIYLYELTLSERRLVDYSACQLSKRDTGLFMTFDKRPNVPGDPVYFVIKIYHGDEIYSYMGNQDADDVPDEVFFFRDAMGAIAQNHFNRQNPISKSMNFFSISDELYGILDKTNIEDSIEEDSDVEEIL